MTESPHDILDRVAADIDTLRGYFPPPDPDAIFKPRSFKTKEEAIECYGLPKNLNYVDWDPSWPNDIDKASRLAGRDAVIWCPERDEPYYIDMSKGFGAAGVSAITGPNGTLTPVANTPGRWFEGARANILGGGPGTVIKPTETEWTAPAQPVPLAYYGLDGKKKGELLGNQNRLLCTRSKVGILCNFTIEGADFGDVAYTALSFTECDRVICKGITFNRASRGRSAIPNTETAMLGIYKGTYEIDGLYIINHEEWSSSPIMWNRTKGGTLKNVKMANSCQYGMPTFWESDGDNLIEEFHTHSQKIGYNIECCKKTFSMTVEGGSITLDQPKGFHFNIDPKYGSVKVTAWDVEFSPNGYVPDALVYHVYATSGKQRDLDIAGNQEKALVPASRWLLT